CKLTRSPKNGCHFNCCTTKAVHNPKTSNDDFPEFQDHPSPERCVLTVENGEVARQRRRFAQSSDRRTAQNLWRCSRGWRGGRAAIVATMQSASESKAAYGLIMGKTLGPVQLGQPTLDFGQEDKPLYRVINRGVCRHGLQRLDNTISGERLLHDFIVMQVIAPGLGQHPTLSISQIRPPAARKFRVSDL